MSDTKQESSVSKGFGFGVGFLAAIAVVNLVILGLMLIIAPERLAARLHGAVIGTPGSGYVAGAPVNAAECTARGGNVVYGGKGCRNYR
ncbi:MAG: hypothetical protein Athens041674_620 [Parcubacteria group bacterium Athens0416_74]|nr:MAG: hypothetical protein Athens041674_620 [Parcubacteria group bacterium Athens0416_74]